jgi:hypothetical protein
MKSLLFISDISGFEKIASAPDKVKRAVVYIRQHGVVLVVKTLQLCLALEKMIKYADRLPLGQTIQRAISSEGNAHSQS